jgi:Cu+-exporting ATPase
MGLKRELKVEEFIAIEGMGVMGKLLGREILIGNKRLMVKNQIMITSEQEELAQKWSNEAKTIVYISIDKKVYGLLSIADTIREGALEAVRKLHKLGIKVIMLTGDNASTAAQIAREIGIDEVISDVLPEEKLAKIREIKRPSLIIL